MLPVSGAAQFIASGASCGLRPVISASGAYWRLVSPAPCSGRAGTGSTGPARAPGLQVGDHRRSRPTGRRRPPPAREHRLGRVDVLVHEREQPSRTPGRSSGRSPSASPLASGQPVRRPAVPRARRSGRSRPRPSARRVPVVDALGDHGELEAGERDVPVQRPESRRCAPRTARPVRPGGKPGGPEPVGDRVAGGRLAALSTPSRSAAAPGRPAGRRAWTSPSPAPRARPRVGRCEDVVQPVVAVDDPAGVAPAGTVAASRARSSSMPASSGCARRPAARPSGGAAGRGSPRAGRSRPAPPRRVDRVQRGQRVHHASARPRGVARRRAGRSARGCGTTRRTRSMT